MGEALEAERRVTALYRKAGIDQERDPGALRLASRLPGVRLEAVPGLPERGCLTRTRSGCVIRWREDLPAWRRDFVVGHELAHYAVRDSDEQACDRMAAAIVAPRPAMRALRREYGNDLARSAAALRTCQTVVARRLTEISDEPCAVVTPRAVHRSKHGLVNPLFCEFGHGHQPAGFCVHCALDRESRELALGQALDRAEAAVRRSQTSLSHRLTDAILTWFIAGKAVR